MNPYDPSELRRSFRRSPLPGFTRALVFAGVSMLVLSAFICWRCWLDYQIVKTSARCTVVECNHAQGISEHTFESHVPDGYIVLVNKTSKNVYVTTDEQAADECKAYGPVGLDSALGPTMTGSW